MKTPEDAAAYWSQLKTLFEQLLEQPESQREDWLLHAVAAPALRQELRSLLTHHAASTGPQALLSHSASYWLNGSGPEPGLRLGPWELVRELGSGGMGQVFEARRVDAQYEGLAAIKLLKRGMDSVAVLQRFAQERQALARLNHPHIARLLDAGATPEGLPYFVMELVAGQPLDVAARGLPLERKLALFLQLADAVAHAHRNLLVHRDLKPGNVMVTPEGQVKLLDFGIAKALDPAEDLAADQTLASARPFTPRYASPEQVRGEPVSTATDIYSLGVLLYQLLTGVRPTGRRASSPAEAARSVLEETPTRPSGLGAEEALDPQWTATRKRLVGDLDNILLKALEKPITRRYASVDAMAQDLRLYLDGRPISARAPSTGYVLGKFITRNRGGVAIAGLALLAVMSALGGMAWQAHRAEQALAVAQSRLKDIRTLSKDVLLRYGDSVTHLPGGMKLKEQLLTDTLTYLDRLLAETGTEELDFKGEIAMAYARLADIQVANNLNSLERDAAGVSNAQRALALFSAAEAGRPDDPFFYMWWGRAFKSQAHSLRARGDVAGALEQLTEGRAAMARGLQRFPDDRDVRSELGSLLFLTGQMQDTLLLASQGRSDAALASLAEASAIYQGLAREERKPDDDRPATVFQLGTIEGARALIHLKRGDLDQARAHGRASVAFQEQALAMQEGNFTIRGGLANSANNLAAICLDIGDTVCALDASDKNWHHLDLLQREEPASPVWAARRLSGALHRGRALLTNGKAAEALVVLQASEPELQRAGPAQQGRLARTQTAEAVALWRLGRNALAQQKAQAARATLQALAARTPEQPGPWLWLGELDAAQASALPGQAQLWAKAARQAYDRAAALGALTGMHRATREQLGN